MMGSSKMHFILGVVFASLISTGTLSMPVGDAEYEDDDEGSFVDAREYTFAPRPAGRPGGRYMDYAVLKIMANYLKDHPDFNPAVHGSLLEQPELVLHRDLRDMKGKGYGIPIPRVGKRSIPESAELIPVPAKLDTASVRTLLSEIVRSMETSKRVQPSTPWSMFKPRVGRGYGSQYPPQFPMNRWGPVPRVGK